MDFPAPNPQIEEAIRARWDALAKPIDGLGRLEELHARIGAIQESLHPRIEERAVLVFCADNGIVEEGVSQSGPEVSYEVASWMGKGESSVCRLARGSAAEVIAVDVGLASSDTPEGVLPRKVMPGSRNFLREPAMTEEECRAAMDCGREMVEECRRQGYRILALGEMGIGNTTTSTAVAAALLGLAPEQLSGRGAGLDDAGLRRKEEVIREGLAFHELDENCPPERILRCVGGLDLAALTGAFLEAPRAGVPLIIDGLITAAAALCAERMAPGCRNYMLASHKGKEPAIEQLLRALEREPVLDARLALGEGTGAVMLFPLLDLTVDYYENAKSFAETRVSPYRRYEEEAASPEDREQKEGER